MIHCPLLTLSSRHRRRINIEEKAKVVAAVWGTDWFISLPQLAVLHYRTILKNMINSYFFQIILVQFFLIFISSYAKQLVFMHRYFFHGYRILLCTYKVEYLCCTVCTNCPEWTMKQNVAGSTLHLTTLLCTLFYCSWILLLQCLKHCLLQAARLPVPCLYFSAGFMIKYSFLE